MATFKMTDKGFYADFKELNHFDNNVDYNEEVAKYNQFVKEGNTAEAQAILRKHGGMIALIGKREQQNNKAVKIWD